MLEHINTSTKSFVIIMSAILLAPNEYWVSDYTQWLNLDGEHDIVQVHIQYDLVYLQGVSIVPIFRR